MVEYDHPAWLAAAGTVGAYVLLLVVMAVLLFLVPLLLFAWF